jgi:release factor glutamine methyltransferase
LAIGDRPIVARSSPVSSALQRARRQLATLDDAALTAEALLAHVLGLSRAQLWAHPEAPVTAEQGAAFDHLLARAALGEPLAYLTGRREFYGLDFFVDRRVLVPRPETELLVDFARSLRPRRALDVGTGSGCIAVALAVSLPQAAITATDVSSDALEIARRNAGRHGVAGRIEFFQSDLLAAWPAAAPTVEPGFDLICANLPYIDRDELRDLPVSRHEPWLALDGGRGGLELIERLLRRAPRVLAPKAAVLLEIGASQATSAAVLARGAFPEARVTVERDLAGLDRLLVVRCRA